ncbi:hypothetical protein [Parachlamydia acanthamoebae]|uniref:Uncharacterized protein n=1 Tax=Parachlamydia acanthamoebae TaxID=83552 RepID=A0A0C1BY84_9BACT|nr:hypothetical protein [Parachlamydia acanthamoebae]KIA76456.1 hypothetical protein DB43_AG00340 [Parachlamydia acanthamoebae]
MKKNTAKQLALRGILSAFVTANNVAYAGTELDNETIQKYGVSKQTSERGNMGYHLMTEDELLLELSPQGVSLYNSLDSKGKELARYVASQRCMGSNACKGLNACQTDKNACAGKGSCKGKGKCALADKNLAVKLVVDKMADKRKEATEGTQNKK